MKPSPFRPETVLFLLLAATPAGGAPSNPCTSLLAPQRIPSGPRPPAARSEAEAAIAGAWAELVRQAGVPPEAFAPPPGATAADLLATPPGALSEAATALDALREQVVALVETEWVDLAFLRAALQQEAEKLVQESHLSREATGQARRRRLHVAGEGIPLGAPITTPALLLPNGNLAVGTRAGVTLVATDGRVLKSFPTGGEVRENLLLIDDGTLVATAHGGATHFLTPALDEISREGPLLEPGEPAHRVMVSQALTGEVVIADEHHISLYDRRGRYLRTFSAVGPLYAPPLQLRNGNWMAAGTIENNRGFVEFFSPHGDRIALHTDLGIVASTGLQLPDGNVVIGSGDRFVRFFSPQGGILGAVETNGSIYSDPVFLPDGTLAIGNIRGVTIVSTNPGARVPLRRNPGTDWTRGQPLLLPDRKTLILTSVGNAIRTWNLDTNREGTIYRANSEITGFPVLIDEGTLVAGDKSGRLHFIELAETTESP